MQRTGEVFSSRNPDYAATALPREVRPHPVGHFEIYVGEPFGHAATDQVELLRRTPKVSAPSATA